MQSHIARWGNSLAVRLPKSVARDAKLREGSAVELRVEGGALVVRPARPHYRLEDLLAGETPDKNGEHDWGRPAGKEEW